MTVNPPKPYKEERPWGDFVEFTKDEKTTVKIVTVRAREALSLQSHSSRDEFWHVLSGEGKVEIDTKTEDVVPGKEFFIPRRTKHRLSAGDTPLSVLEIAFGDFDESDITRFDDRYGRTQT